MNDQQKWYSPAQVAKQRNLSPATVAGLIKDGLLEAVNVARLGSVRNCWRSSEAMLAAFDERRANKPATATAARESKSSRRIIAKPTKDYFATSQAGAK